MQAARGSVVKLPNIVVDEMEAQEKIALTGGGRPDGTTLYGGGGTTPWRYGGDRERPRREGALVPRRAPALQDCVAEFAKPSSPGMAAPPYIRRIYGGFPFRGPFGGTKRNDSIQILERGPVPRPGLSRIYVIRRI